VTEVRRFFKTTADHTDTAVGVGDSPLLSPPALMAFMLAAANELAHRRGFAIVAKAELTILAPVLAGAELEVVAVELGEARVRAEAYVATHRVAELVVEYIYVPRDRAVNSALR